MAIQSKAFRARRSLLKLAGVLVAAGMGTSSKQAAARTNHTPSSGPCFLRGTHVQTADGYRAVETLAPGDKVAAHFGGQAAIKEIHSFTLGRSGPRREWLGDTRPVRITRGALGENMPAQNLVLTASHAVFVGGILVPAGQLVNGSSIVLEQAVGRDELEFFHIELERHDVLDVQGAPCESLRRPHMDSCAPVASFGGPREEIRSRLRSLASVIVDRRQPLDVIRDDLEERGAELARAA